MENWINLVEFLRFLIYDTDVKTFRSNTTSDNQICVWKRIHLITRVNRVADFISNQLQIFCHIKNETVGFSSPNQQRT